MGFIKEVKEMWLREFAKREEQKQKYRIGQLLPNSTSMNVAYHDILIP